ncbi:MAG: hypothetical protein RIG61_11855 [Deltaproteobacteria bacterium]
MKNHLLITFVMIFSLLAAACNDNGKETRNAPPGDTAELESPGPTPGPEVKEYDFRGSDWGATREEVMATERNEPVYEDDDTLEYKGVVEKMLMLITYKFRDDKLVRGGFVLNQQIRDKNEYPERYNKLKKILIEANGAPRKDIEKNLNPNAVINDENKGDAVCRGDIVYGAQWVLPDTVINLLLNGQQSQCYLAIIYTSREELEFRTNQSGGQEDG